MQSATKPETAKYALAVSVVIAAVAAFFGYINRDVGRVEYGLQKLAETYHIDRVNDAYGRGKNDKDVEQIHTTIDTLRREIANLDITLQREMRLNDEVTNKKVDAADDSSQERYSRNQSEILRLSNRQLWLIEQVSRLLDRQNINSEAPNGKIGP